MERFKKGDIVANVFTHNDNPYHLGVYLGTCTIRQGNNRHKGYKVLAYDGEIHEIFQAGEPLVCEGHMEEYDRFIDALRELAND